MFYNFDDLEFKPISIGNFVHKAGIFDVEARPHAAISFRTSGTAEFEVGGKRIQIRAGDILFLPSDTPYRVEYSPSESIVAHLVGCNYFEAEKISLEDASLIEGRFQRLLNVWNETHSVNKAKSIIYDILEKLSEDRKTIIGDTAFANCVSYIQLHFFDPELNIDKICEHGSISVSTLQRKFHDHFGMSPKQYLIKLRMNRALEFLIANELSVQEIALACGFSDEKYFSRAFKNQYGYPPSQIKKHILI